ASLCFAFHCAPMLALVVRADEGVARLTVDSSGCCRCRHDLSDKQVQLAGTETCPTERVRPCFLRPVLVNQACRVRLATPLLLRVRSMPVSVNFKNKISRQRPYGRVEGGLKASECDLSLIV